jgi:L-rhamnose-H+ transport protein
MGVALGYCAAFGTLLPPIVGGEFSTKVLETGSGNIILSGVGICLAGIAMAGWAGRSKEREMAEEEKRAAIREFNFPKGILVATFSGIMSASMAYGLDAGQPIAELSARHGTPMLWTGLPKLCVVLLGGFTTNALWCLFLNVKNRTGGQYLSAEFPRWRNYGFSALAGTVWYLQFFFYSMGETQMGEYKFSSWTIHMASIIIFSSLWGIGLKEWQGSSRSTRTILALGLLVLILSTVVIGYGNYSAAVAVAVEVPGS